MAWVWFKFSNLITPIRVSKETEMQGLDGPEMGALGIPISPCPAGTDLSQLKRPLSVLERPRPRWPRPLLWERVADWRPAGSRNTDLGPGRHSSELSKGLLFFCACARIRPDHCGCSSMVEHKLPKLDTRVRFPSPALG